MKETENEEAYAFCRFVTRHISKKQCGVWYWSMLSHGRRVADRRLNLLPIHFTHTSDSLKTIGATSLKH